MKYKEKCLIKQGKEYMYIMLVDSISQPMLLYFSCFFSLVPTCKECHKVYSKFLLLCPLVKQCHSWAMESFVAFNSGADVRHLFKFSFFICEGAKLGRKRNDIL